MVFTGNKIYHRLGEDLTIAVLSLGDGQTSGPRPGARNGKGASRALAITRRLGRACIPRPRFQTACGPNCEAFARCRAGARRSSGLPSTASYGTRSIHERPPGAGGAEQSRGAVTR